MYIKHNGKMLVLIYLSSLKITLATIFLDELLFGMFAVEISFRLVRNVVSFKSNQACTNSWVYGVEGCDLFISHQNYNDRGYSRDALEFKSCRASKCFYSTF